MRLLIILSLALFSFGANEVSHAEPVFETLCSRAEPLRNNLRSYENEVGEYTLNIQMMETYKHFRTCKSKDPNVKIAPAFDVQLSALEKELQKQKDSTTQEWKNLNQRSLEIFTQTRALYQEYLEKLIKKNPSSNSVKIFKQFKERVRTVRLNKSRYCNSFNSTYNFVSHSIDTCNELLTYPRTTLITIYAHELTHSIDPCSLQLSLYHITTENPFSTGQLGAESDKDAYTVLPLDWALDSLFLERDQIQTVMSPLPLASNPYRSVLTCLQSSDSIHAQARKNPLKKATIQDEERMCSSSLQDGQMTEGFADWAAYEVLAHFLSKKTESDLSRQIFEGTLNVITNQCLSLQSDIEIEMRKAIVASDKCRGENEAFLNFQSNLRNQLLLDTHPQGKLRINKLYGAQPVLANLLKKHLKMNRNSKSDDITYCKQR